MNGIDLPQMIGAITITLFTWRKHDDDQQTADRYGQRRVSFSGASADQVRFAYGEETILDQVSVEVPKNQIVGIVGRSGSGKSTLLKLFMRFWEVQQGSIRISGKAVDQINTDNLRNMESFVTQQTHLFHDSIRNNLRIADRVYPVENGRLS